jgi:hypothetical protein
MLGPRTRVVAVPLVLAATTVGFAALTDFGILGSFVLGAIAALTLLAALDSAAGLALLLGLMPFDRTIHPALQQWAWYPRALHVVDLIAVALLVGFAVRVLRRQVRLTWRWYDAVYLAFLAVLSFSALHGLLDHYRYVLREGRPIPYLLSYLPAREVFTRVRERGKQIEPLVLGYGIAFCLVAGVLAYQVEGTWGRASDVLLPRLPFVADITPLLLVVLVAMGAYAWAPAERRLSCLAGTSLVVYGMALAIANTRTYFLGFALAGVVIAVLLLRPREGRWRQAARMSAALGLLVVGMAVPYVIRAGVVRLEQREVSVSPSPTPAPAAAADPMGEGGGVEPAPVRELAPMSVEQLTRVERLRKGQDENMVNRTREVQAAWRDTKSHLIGGVGIGMPLRYAMMQFDGKSKPVQQSFLHSGYFAVLRSSGLLGLAGLMAVIGCFIALGLRRRFEWRDSTSVACVLALVALVPMIQLVNVIFMPGAVWLAAVLGWIGTSATASERVEPEAPVAVLAAAGK